MAILKKGEILQFTVLRRETVPVPEWGGGGVCAGVQCAAEGSV